MACHARSGCVVVCLQVSAVAEELLQHLAAQHTNSKELEELLLDGPAGVAVLTAVGRSLHTQPGLFTALAAVCKVGINAKARFGTLIAGCLAWRF